ncbi:type II/IV secretion system ATPase subunit [Candidatus Nanohalobium constans]|uniref:Archaeal flagellar protein FlaI n=1 Tax=Candidatus Nanohalobium constans TaxID=2565781 RepID=A0A5Q0UH83_9ARCH|nr:ATPase, T2SS/T4P/T4SS family [Candidatus Nanohalobium constans]QGA80998.1 archaeal flagellar protein FlaI [Candidatus Nanohalobium constans]
MSEEVIEEYTVKADQVPAKISIIEGSDYVPHYELKRPQPSAATEAILDDVREQTIAEADINAESFQDSNEIEKSREIFRETAKDILEEEIPHMSDSKLDTLIGNLIHEMLGMGDVEILLTDNDLEEIVINNAEEPAWVYHKSHGWLKTDITFESENEIYNYASEIGRGVGKNISSLHPLLDAHLPSGDRTNATLSPISTQGNTITIRKFARDPWTITDFIKIGTISPEMAAFLWLCIQYEMNIIISGGTGTGKTSLLNVLTPFMPPSQRVISIEDTRELSLPEFLHWVPMTTREQNPDGQGEVSMQDLLVNSLRMRPDRILVGEIRRKRQAEVLFEAMQTGHSVYSTLHADTAETTIKRMTHPPIDVPETVVGAVDLNVVMFRDRRRNFRRVLEIAEVIDEGEDLKPHTIYDWGSQEDTFYKQGESEQVKDKLSRLTGMTEDEINEDIQNKKMILKWLVENEVDDLDRVGRVVAEYYNNEDSTLDKIRENEPPENIIPSDR